VKCGSMVISKTAWASSTEETGKRATSKCSINHTQGPSPKFLFCMRARELQRHDVTRILHHRQVNEREPHLHNHQIRGLCSNVPRAMRYSRRRWCCLLAAQRMAAQRIQSMVLVERDHSSGRLGFVYWIDRRLTPFLSNTAFAIERNRSAVPSRSIFSSALVFQCELWSFVVRRFLPLCPSSSCWRVWSS
jgi:hypothetical protein